MKEKHKYKNDWTSPREWAFSCQKKRLIPFTSKGFFQCFNTHLRSCRRAYHLKQLHCLLRQQSRWHLKVDDNIVKNWQVLIIKTVCLPTTSDLYACSFTQAIYFTTRVTASQISQRCGNIKLGKATSLSQQATEGFIWSGKLTKTNRFFLLRALPK